jgi:hypothetical protein
MMMGAAFVETGETSIPKQATPADVVTRAMGDVDVDVQVCNPPPPM